MKFLSPHLLRHIEAKDYWLWKFPELDWPDSSDRKVCCPFHNETRPSLDLSVDGKWYCHGCKRGGPNILKFHSENEDIPTSEAAEELYHEFIHPVIPKSKVEEWHNAFIEQKDMIGYAKGRYVTPEIMTEIEMGWNGRQIMFPVKNVYGLYVNARRYNVHRPRAGMPKCIHYKKKGEERQYGSPPELFPFIGLQQAKQRGFVILCEGEWDTLALLSLGLPAVTSTNGSQSWPEQYNDLFKGLDIFIAYDNDEAGRTGSKRVVAQLKKWALSIRRINVPKAVGKDVTDWMKSKEVARKPKFWLNRMKRARVVVENDPQDLPESEITRVTLAQASEARYENKPIEVDGIVVGMMDAPYLVPRKYRVACSQRCETCPNAERGREYTEMAIDPDDKGLLHFIDCSESARNKRLASIAGISTKDPCCPRVEVTQSMNVERVLVSPTVEDMAEGMNVRRLAYVVGHGLSSNRAYTFQGQTCSSVKDSSAVQLFTKYTPLQGEIETFTMDEAKKASLKQFQARRGHELEKLREIAAWQSSNVTRIVQRTDLHILTDLVYHSVPAFEFNGEPIPKGMLDVLLLGDTRVGKGYVVEGLQRYYGLGETASGENCSFAGLVGGINQHGNYRFATWGILPLNNRRLVVIDEASALSQTDFGLMSRVRSEGVAEITKIIRERAAAMVRLIWIANPRSGKPMNTYETGVQAIKELVGNNEDISRFDLCLTVTSDEVSTAEINRSRGEPEDPEKFDQQAMKDLVMFAWSRNVSQVVFTPPATKIILNAAVELGKRYTAEIPLVLGENARIKIARIAAAIAARLYSVDKTGEKIVIKPGHARAAIKVMGMCYDKPSMGFDLYSDLVTNNLDLNYLEDFMRPHDPDFDDRVRDLLGVSVIRRPDQEVLGIDPWNIGKLKSAGLLMGDNDQLVKTPQFIHWLKGHLNGTVI